MTTVSIHELETMMGDHWNWLPPSYWQAYLDFINQPGDRVCLKALSANVVASHVRQSEKDTENSLKELKDRQGIGLWNYLKAKFYVEAGRLEAANRLFALAVETGIDPKIKTLISTDNLACESIPRNYLEIRPTVDPFRDKAPLRNESDREVGENFVDPGECTFCMPSNRDFAKSRRSIESLVKLKSKGFRVVVSDNSNDGLKIDFLKDHGIVVDSGPKEGATNFKHAMDMANTRFISMVGDDDWLEFGRGDFPAPRLGYGSRGCIGFRPSTKLFDPQNKCIIRANDFRIENARSIERLIQYSRACKGTNETYYSMWDSEIFKAANNIIFRENPLGGGWTDWSVVWAMLSMGQLQSTTEYTFIYNLNNWLTAEIAAKSVTNSLLAAGLNPSAERKLPIFQALDFLGLSFRLSKNSRHYPEINSDDAKYWFLLVLGAVNKRPGGDFHRLIDQYFLPTFSAALEAVDKVKPGLAKQYRDYCAPAVA